MKLPTTALMIAALAIPAVAVGRDDHGHRDEGRGGGAARGPAGPSSEQTYRESPHNGGGYGSHGDQGPAPGPGYRGRPPYGPPPRYGAPNPYGAPRAHIPGDWNDYAPQRGEAHWRRGQFFPPAYRGEVVGDYYRYHLRRPPPGYYWYRNGDDFILAAITSGLIFEVVSGGDF